MDRAPSLLDYPERSGPASRWLPYALLLSVTFALYSSSLYFQFVWDDVGYITKNYRIQALDWMHFHAIWTNTYLGHYAPVQHTYLAVFYHFFGMDPFGYHLGQVLVHAAIVCLLYLLLKKLESGRIALLALLLYAVHPTNIETVAWISESKSTLAFLFFLLSFWFFIRMRERQDQGSGWLDGTLAALFLVLSLLSKINTVVGPAVFLLYDYKQGATLKTLRWRSLLPFFAISGVMTLVHLGSFHGSAELMETQYMGGPGVHLMNLPLLLSFYVQMTVFPAGISAWQMFPAQLQFSWVAALGWTGLLLAFGGVLLRGSRTTKFWSLWFVLFLLPVLHLVPFPIWVADRYLYVPLVGGLVLLSRVFFRIWDAAQRSWQPWVLEAAMLAMILVLAGRTRNHLPVWANDLTLWAATTPTCMTSAYCHMQLGLSLLQNGQTHRGITELIEAVRLREGPRTLERLGDAFSLGARDYRQALVAYQLALEKMGSGTPGELYGKMARAYYLAGDMEQAARVVAQGKNANPNDLGLWIIDGFVLWKQGKWEEARYSLRRSLAMVGGTVNSARFFTEFLGRPGEVGRMLADLRSSSPGAQN